MSAVKTSSKESEEVSLLWLQWDFILKTLKLNIDFGYIGSHLPQLSEVLYKVFSLTWTASTQIYWNKRKCLHKKRVQLPEDWFGTPTWPPFHCFGTPIWPPWCHVKTIYSSCSSLDHKDSAGAENRKNTRRPRLTKAHKGNKKFNKLAIEWVFSFKVSL